jgi:hypothetical protein
MSFLFFIKEFFCFIVQHKYDEEIMSNICILFDSFLRYEGINIVDYPPLFLFSFFKDRVDSYNVQQLYKNSQKHLLSFNGHSSFND